MKKSSAIEIFTEHNVSLPFAGITEKIISGISRKAIKYLGLKKVIVTLIFTDNFFIQAINKKFRDKDYPTDVISFAYRENPFPEIENALENLGDIYISLEKAKEQAENNSIEIKTELTRLIIHGLLHLIGYDHEKSGKEALKMEKFEAEIFEFINKN